MQILFLLLLALQVTLSHVLNDGQPHERNKTMLACLCGHTVTPLTADKILNFPSPNAMQQRTLTLLDREVPVQRLKNPHGSEFDVISLTAASEEADRTILTGDSAYSSSSWFPSYSWRLIGCPSCNAHL